jgi:hypothetical protein
VSWGIDQECFCSWRRYGDGEREGGLFIETRQCTEAYEENIYQCSGLNFAEYTFTRIT